MQDDKSDRRALEILRDAELPTVTDEELSNFDASSFEDRGPVDLRKAEQTVAAVRTRLNAIEVSESENAVPDGLNRLFAFVGCAGVGKSYLSSRLLVDLTIRAFVDVRDGWSADYVLLDPVKNLDYLQRCWQLGATSTPETLNRTLMNARKAGRLSAWRSTRSYSLPRNALDMYSFAAEMSVREVQNRVWQSHSYDRFSLDTLLCNPEHSMMFDSLARQVVPGFTPLEYRWAALALRKARRLARTPSMCPTFEDWGLLEDLQPSRLPTQSGIYWLVFGDQSVFVGAAANLKRQLDCFSECLGSSGLPSWVTETLTVKPRMRIVPMAESAVTDRECLRSRVLHRFGSQLNFVDRGLFSKIAKGA